MEEKERAEKQKVIDKKRSVAQANEVLMEQAQKKKQ